MTMVVVLVLVFLLGLAVVVAVARDRGPTPTDVAIAYGRSLAARDFDAVYRMTDDEVLRGRNRPRWIAEQSVLPHAAMLLDAVTARSTVERADHARVVLTADDNGATAIVDLALRQRQWVVAAWTMAGDTVGGDSPPLSPPPSTEPQV